MSTTANGETLQTAGDPNRDRREVVVNIEVRILADGARNITSAIESANAVVNKAREFGEAKGEVVFGRQRFPL